MRIPPLQKMEQSNPAKGCLIGIILALPFWAVILGVILWIR